MQISLRYLIILSACCLQASHQSFLKKIFKQNAAQSVTDQHVENPNQIEKAKGVMMEIPSANYRRITRYSLLGDDKLQHAPSTDYLQDISNWIDNQAVENYVATVPQLREPVPGTLKSYLNLLGSENQRQAQANSHLEDFIDMKKDLHNIHISMKNNLHNIHNLQVNTVTKSERKLINKISNILEDIHNEISKHMEENLLFNTMSKDKTLTQTIPSNFPEKLKDNIFQQMQVLLQDLAEHLDYKLGEKPAYKPSNLNCKLQRIFFQTVNLVYQHELITLPQLKSLFEESGALRVAYQNMFQSFSIQYGNSKDFKNILDSWYSSHFRDIFSAIGPQPSYIELLKLALQYHPDFYETGSMKEVVSKRIYLFEHLMHGSGEDFLSLKKSQSYGAFVEVFKRIQLIYIDEGEGTIFGSNFIFQLLEFTKKNDPKHWVSKLYEGNKFFKAMFDCMSVKNKTLAKLENIEDYLKNYFPQIISSDPNPYLIYQIEKHVEPHEEHGVETSTYITHKEELTLISKYIDNTIDEYEKNISNIFKNQSQEIDSVFYSHEVDKKHESLKSLVGLKYGESKTL